MDDGGEKISRKEIRFANDNLQLCITPEQWPPLACCIREPAPQSCPPRYTQTPANILYLTLRRYSQSVAATFCVFTQPKLMKAFLHGTSSIWINYSHP